MREAGKIVAAAHALVATLVRPGVSTWVIDQKVEELLRSYDATPAFKGYHGFPSSICASVDSVVVHGIPSKKVVLQEGSIVGVDIGAFFRGYCADSAWTYPVGSISEEATRLLKVTKESLFIGIDKALVGSRLSDVSHAIQSYVEAEGFGVVRDFVGHGVGQSIHEPPQIPHFGPPGKGPLLKEGMTLAIEPMVTTGDYRIKVLPDSWTAVTRDGGLSAHFEHTIAVTSDGPCVLTTL